MAEWHRIRCKSAKPLRYKLLMSPLALTISSGWRRPTAVQSATTDLYGVRAMNKPWLDSISAGVQSTVGLELDSESIHWLTSIIVVLFALLTRRVRNTDKSNSVLYSAEFAVSVQSTAQSVLYSPECQSTYSVLKRTSGGLSGRCYRTIRHRWMHPIGPPKGTRNQPEQCQPRLATVIEILGRGLGCCEGGELVLLY